MTSSPPDRNIGVALGIPEPYGSELQAWRERLGDPNAHRIVPHITLLPPTLVASEQLDDIEEHLRAVAAASRPFDIRLRGSATFLPISSVVFVPLVQGIAECEQLAAAVRRGPLRRDLNFPYHPHVTVVHDLPDEALYRGWTQLTSYEAAFRAFGLTLFEQGPDLTWRPQRDFTFGGGGLPGPAERRSAREGEGW
ncbi:MAG TPA: 2'-5' RNA ligase family protein [Mycobacteriales bacterium]|jgi:2'-5' RNA ligase|nr:2'-5' RNA ligase family protein [Mycobacteriales bacterium]